MNNILISEEWLQANGWTGRIFFYQIGGGEDESDTQIWEKDGIALNDNYGCWWKAASDDLNYINGFPREECVSTVDEL